MNKVQQIYDDTAKLIDLLEKKNDMDRDEKITQIHEYLGKREKELKELSPPFSKQEKELGQKIVDQNKQLASLLEQEKLLIQQDIKNLHAKKISNQKYTNPYQNLATGGILYDKRN